jgi:hypothetical protein
MKARLHIDMEGDLAALLAFAVRLKPIVDELDIDIDAIQHVQVCEECGQRLHGHKGWFQCMQRGCSMYGAPVSPLEDHAMTQAEREVGE